MSREKIVICGAGLVGSMLALSLKKRNFDVEVFEKRPDPRNISDTEARSINLVISRKGLAVLEQEGIDGHVKEISTPVYGRMMHDLQGELTYQPYGKDETEFNLSISRNRLNNLLIDLAEKAGAKFYFEDLLENLDLKSKSAQFSTTGAVDYDRFFGADGAGSKSRKELKELLGSVMKDEITPLGVYYKELLMPYREPGEYVMDKKALHIWPRGQEMLMGLTNLDGSFTMTLYMAKEKFESLNTSEKILDYFTEYYADSIEYLPNLVEDFQSHPIGFLGSLECSHWVYEDSFALIGDAAHAIVPFFGQGTNAGFNDVAFLMDKLDRGVDSWKEIFQMYQETQKANGDAIRDMSIENFQVMSAKVADPSFLLQKQLEREIERHFPQAYKSRYGLVMYTDCPYADALKIGQEQQVWIQELLNENKNIDQIDFTQIKEDLTKRSFTFIDS